jgi:hypothetical protein
MTGGLTQALEGISERPGNLLAVEIEGVEVVFCLPSIRAAAQYQTLISLSTDVSTENLIWEHIFQHVVVDRYLADSDGSIPAGIPETIGRLVLSLSGITEYSKEYTEELFKAYREQQDETLIYMKRTICQVFMGYTFESLDATDYQSLVNIFIQAEKVLLDRGIIEKVHSFIEPEKTKMGNTIRQEREALSEFDRPTEEDPVAMARTRKMREIAIERAKQEELRYKQRMRR